MPLSTGAERCHDLELEAAYSGGRARCGQHVLRHTAKHNTEQNTAPIYGIKCKSKIRATTTKHEYHYAIFAGIVSLADLPPRG